MHLLSAVGRFSFQSLALLLLVVAYFFTITVFSQTLGIIIGYFSLISNRIWPNRPEMKISAMNNQIFEIGITSTIVAAFIFFHLESSSWIKLWQSPLLLAVMLFTGVRMAMGVGAQNPALKAVASVGRVSSLPILLVVTLGVFKPYTITSRLFAAAFVSAAVIRVMAILVVGNRIFLKYRSFEELDQRHDRLGKAISDLNLILTFSGESEQWARVAAIIESAKKSYRAALENLGSGALSDAERELLKGESELSQVEILYDSVLRSSFFSELGRRMEEALDNVKTLKGQAGTGKVESEFLDQISDRAQKLRDAPIDVQNLSYSRLASELAPYKEVISEIDDISAALRFQRNADSAISNLELELSQSKLTIRVAKELGLNPQPSEDLAERVQGDLDKFRSGSISKSTEVVRIYQALQATLAELSKEVGSLILEMERAWTVARSNELGVDAYIPKKCSTNEPVTGVLLVRGTGGPPEVTLSGTLLELQTNPTLDLLAPGSGSLVTSFSFAGKKAGKATLSLAFRGHTPSQKYRVLVESSLAELAKDAIIYSVPLGAFAMLVMWRLGWKLEDAGPLAGAIGSVAAIVIFGLQVLHAKVKLPYSGRNLGPSR